MTCQTHHHEDTPPSVSILPEAAAIISLTTAPKFTLTADKLDFDSKLAWGYDGQSKRFWIGKVFSRVEELNWDALNLLQVLELYLSSCINTSSDLSAKLAICRFQDLMVENLPWFEALLEEANRVAYPKDRAESSIAAAQRLAPSRLDLIRSGTLTDEETFCWRSFIHNEMVRGLAVLGWSCTGPFGFTLFLSDRSSVLFNHINEILLLNSDFLYNIFELRTHICNVNSLESQEMIKTIKAHLEKEGRLAEDASSDSDFSFLSSPTATLNTAIESRITELEDVWKSWKEVTGCEWEEDEARNLPPSTPQTANEAEAEIPTVSKTSVVMIHEAEAEASTKTKGKGVMTEEVEERLMKEQREREERRRRRRRREEEEMAEQRKIQERKAAMLFREQQIQPYAKQLDDLKARFPATTQLQEDEALALQLQEQFNKEEEEREKKKREEAKFRITDSELAKEMREEWIAALISQGEDATTLRNYQIKKSTEPSWVSKVNWQIRKGMKKKKRPSKNPRRPLHST
ncbi:hypothetical protein L1987_09494 [Smallanthus sonchifolius]|uniref:Uncharacterized protein n=1 Tax=Smallanthus sonchifolius TaxID=185202 RepID=A0ACB9JN35_9ASTR|nr:hypothetical protein L1987_09494 [Smallanthus sonchifolius]